MKIAILAVALAILFGVIVVGVSRNDIASCNTWKKEAKQYPGYYITEWQQQQCDYYKIGIPAPTVKPEAATTTHEDI